MQAMKINAKLNGINVKLNNVPSWMSQPFIVFGEPAPCLIKQARAALSRRKHCRLPALRLTASM